MPQINPEELRLPQSETDRRLIDTAHRGRVSRVAYHSLRRGHSVREALIELRQRARAPENWPESYVQNLYDAMIRQRIIGFSHPTMTAATTSQAEDIITQDFSNSNDAQVAITRLRRFNRFIRTEEQTRSDGTRFYRVIYRARTQHRSNVQQQQLGDTVCVASTREFSERIAATQFIRSMQGTTNEFIRIAPENNFWRVYYIPAEDRTTRTIRDLAQVDAARHDPDLQFVVDNFIRGDSVQRVAEQLRRRDIVSRIISPEEIVNLRDAMIRLGYISRLIDFLQDERQDERFPQAPQIVADLPDERQPIIPVRLRRQRPTRVNTPTPVIEPTDEPIELQASNNINTNDFNLTSTYGVEIEFLLPRNINHTELALKLTRAGIATRVEQWNHDENHRNRAGLLTRKYWKLSTDGSVHSHVSSHNGGNELVSPILKGKNGLIQIENICKILIENNCMVNKTCGLHVHHGCKHLHGHLAEQVARNAVVIYNKYQPKFDKMMPRSRRDNQYARNMTTSEMQTLRDRLECTTNRYKVVNIQSFWRHGTIEFRQHSGTLEFQKIINWIKITQKVMVRARELCINDIWEYSFRHFENEFNFGTELITYIEERYRKFAEAA